MNQDHAAKCPEKLLLCNFHRFLELSMLACGLWSVPCWVHASDTATKAGLNHIFHLRCFAHAVIQAINFKNEFCVHLLVHFIQLFFIKRDAPVVKNGIRDDLFAKMLKDEASAAQFGNVLLGVGPRLLERSLVVVKPVTSWVINSADVAYYIEAVEYILLPSSNDQAISVLTSLEEHSRGKDLVTVE